MDWIKLSTGIFVDEKILLLQSDEYICIWLRLLCLAGRFENDGVFLMKEGTPYTVSQLATIMGKPTRKLKDALAAFQSLGMVDVIDGVITIPNWCKHQGTSEARERFRAANRERQKRYADRQRRVINGVSNASDNGKMTQTDKDIDIEIDIKEKYKKEKRGGNVSRRSKAVRGQEHEYSEADFEDIYLKPDAFDLQAAAEDERGKDDERGREDHTGVQA